MRKEILKTTLYFVLFMVFTICSIDKVKAVSNSVPGGGILTYELPVGVDAPTISASNCSAVNGYLGPSAVVR